MNRSTALVLAGSSLFALATAAAAQPSTTPPATQSADPATVAQEANEVAEERHDEGAIIITARRRAESLIDVPATVNAVTSQDIDEFQIQDFEDISQLVPGLTLNSDNSGFNATAQVRGVNFQVTAQGSPTVEMYLNEVPVEPNTLFQGTFDVGQIEVLRGPQGTIRGRSAPSGAITYTTRRPDLNEWGGSISMTGSSIGDLNYQGALNVPIISDMLALRIAGLWDENDAGGVKSVNNASNPNESTKSFRATLRFEPTSTISAVIMYQWLRREISSFGQNQFGPGAAGNVGFPGFIRPGTSAALSDNLALPGTQACPVGAVVGVGTCGSLAGGNPGAFAPPNFNGPALLEADADGHFRTVADWPSFTMNSFHFLSAQLDWRFAGQRLSYVGGWVDGGTLNLVDSDGTNTIVGVRRQQSRNACCGQDRRSHELRLSSEERLFGLFDYTVGAFYQKIPRSITINEDLNQLLLPGAFGSPLGLAATTALGLPPSISSPFTYDPKYTVGRINRGISESVEKSINANVMFHLGENTEISVGGRKIWRKRDAEGAPVVTNGVVALRNPNGLGACPATLSGPGAAGQNVINGRVLGSTYAGTCDVELVPGNGAPLVLVPPTPRTVRKFDPFVYLLSVSHKFTPDLMAYATYGTSWRAGPGPVTAAPVCAAGLSSNAPDPTLCDPYNFLFDEKSKAIEFGFKGSFIDQRLNVAVALYQQKFDSFFIRGDSAATLLTGNCSPPIPTANVQGGCSVSTGTFTYNADVKVKGIDAEANFRLNEDLNFSALFSWSKGRFKNSPIPCRDTNLDGVPDSLPLPTNPAAWVAAGGPFGPTLCPNAGSSTTAPPWNLTLRGEYSHDVFTGGRAFIRTLFNYYPENTNRDDAVSVDGPPVTQVPPESYAILNLWIGLRGERGDWEVSASARNLLNNKTVLSRSLDQANLINPPGGLFGIPSSGTSVPSGYRTISFVDRREFALNFRYSFGSR